MSDDVPRHLESITIAKLRTVADEYGVDVSSCKHKKEYVDAIALKGITEEQVQTALAKEEERFRAAGLSEQRRESTKLEVESIARGKGAPKELPKGEEDEVESNIDKVFLSRPSFFELESMMQIAWDRMIMMDYHEALRINAEARRRMLDRFSSFQVYSAAVSIRAAENVISALEDAQGKVDSRLKTALAEAKKSFVDGTPRRREESLGQLEELAMGAYKAFSEGSADAEAELRTLLSDYESFGTRTDEARQLLQIAEQAKRAFNVSEYAKLLEDVRASAEKARDWRRAEIEESLHIARASVEEAKELGAALTVGDKDLSEAKEALDASAFRKAMDLISSVERVADRAQLNMVSDRDVHEMQTNKVAATIAGLETALQEAASYGMDVGQGLFFAKRARTALHNRDIVSAAKLTRHLKTRSSSMQAELDKKRVEKGVAVRIKEAKCGKCGKEALYSFPDDRRKCIECGHSFSIVATPRPRPMTELEPPVSDLVHPTAKGPGPEVQGDRGPAKRKLKARDDTKK